jgi:NitT/TauT family transport system permease protein
MGLSGRLWPALGMTLFRLSVGVAIGASIGMLLGWSLGINRAMHIALDPIVAALHPLPKLAIFPIVMVILGIGEASKIALVAVTAFFPVLINTLAGVMQIDRAYREAAMNYGASGSTLIRRVILPGSLPMALTGLRLAANGALTVTIAIEMLSAQQGLGTAIWLAWQTLRTEELYATLVVIALLGNAMNWTLGRLTEYLIPWQRW